MRSRDIANHTKPEYLLKEHWKARAKNSGSANASGLEPVLHLDSPPLFNQVVDALQFRSVRRAITIATLPDRARILDVGCGTGRGLRRHEQLEYRATGVEATFGMLRVARECETTAPNTAREAYRLPFPDAKFDSVSDITVIQHIPVSLQSQAISEMVRVIRFGGQLILMELIGGEGQHIFPREPWDWIEQAAPCGAKLVGWFGQEYFLLDRLLVRVAQAVTRTKGIPSNTFSPRYSLQRSTMMRRIYWRLRHVTVPISAWIEPLTDRICPAHFATHGVFVFRK